MKSQHPVVRLLTLTSIAIVMGLTAMMGLRWLGSQESFPLSNHPWMQGSTWLLARLTPDACNGNEIHSLLALDHRWRIWLDVQLDANKQWIVVCSQHPFSLDGTPGPKLRDILPQIEDGVIFNVRGSESDAATSFLQVVEPWAGKRVDIGIASPAQSLLRELRKRKPEWLFAADFSTWTKLKMYVGMGIETAADLWPDFFIADSDPEAPNFFSIPAANEIARRKKVLLLEWNKNGEIPLGVKEHLQGVLTNRPKNFSVDAIFGKKGAK